MKDIDLDELKSIQLDILQVIHDFCQENKINYSLGCGTLLGAIRHKGYIPWDDDIDIYMLRREYDKLLHLFPNTKNHVRISSLERENDWDKAYAKAYDERTICEEDSNCKVIGVSIDLFPIDFVPKNDKKWLRYNKRRRILKIASDIKTMRITDEYSTLKKIIIKLCKIVLTPIHQKTLVKWLNNYAQKFNNTESEYVFESCQGLLLKNKFSSSVFSDYMDIQFEDRQFKAMSGFDEYLKCAYGDYMRLPPENKRVSHHSFKAWWK